MTVCQCLLTFCQRGMALLLTNPDMNVALNVLKNVSLTSENKIALELGTKVGKWVFHL